MDPITLIFFIAVAALGYYVMFLPSVEEKNAKQTKKKTSKKKIKPAS